MESEFLMQPNTTHFYYNSKNEVSNCMTNQQLEALHYRFLTDRILQQYIKEISCLMNLYIPYYEITEEGLKAIYKPDDAHEIKRIIEMRDNYIKKYYPELIIHNNVTE